MPSSPELGNTPGKIRTVEILHQTESHDLRRTHCNGRISCKISIDLKCKQYACHYQIASAICAIIPIYRINNHRNTVCNHQLQKISPQHQQQAVSDSFKIKRMLLVKLAQQVFRTLNRTGHQLRKKRHKKRIFHKISLYFRIFPVYVHRITQSLENIKGDPDRK